jgi:hypothetical protein
VKKIAIVTYLEVVFQHFPGGTEEKLENISYPLCGSRFELLAYGTQSISVYRDLRWF